MICLYVGVCLVLPWSVESFPFMFWRWRNKLKWAPFEFFAPSPLLRVRSWLHPYKGHCEQQAMRDEGVIYVAGHPLLNRRCARLAGCIRLRNDLYCVEWGVKLYSLNSTQPQNYQPTDLWLVIQPFQTILQDVFIRVVGPQHNGPLDPFNRTLEMLLITCLLKRCWWEQKSADHQFSLAGVWAFGCAVDSTRDI